MGLTRDAILGADDLKVEKVSVPEWGDDGYVKMMTGAERDHLDALTVARKGKHIDINMANFRARVVALTMCDEKGALLFTEEDVKALGGKGAAPIDRVYEAAARLNRITKQDAEELTGNLNSAPKDASGSI